MATVLRAFVVVAAIPGLAAACAVATAIVRGAGVVVVAGILIVGVMAPAVVALVPGTWVAIGAVRILVALAVGDRRMPACAVLTRVARTVIAVATGPRLPATHPVPTPIVGRTAIVVVTGILIVDVNAIAVNALVAGTGISVEALGIVTALVIAPGNLRVAAGTIVTTVLRALVIVITIPGLAAANAVTTAIVGRTAVAVVARILVVDVGALAVVALAAGAWVSVSTVLVLLALIIVTPGTAGRLTAVAVCPPVGIHHR